MEKRSGAEMFSSRVKNIIASIPEGRVATYGQIAMLAGNRRAARQVAWILHSSSSKHGLPWHRVINRLGKISLPHGGGYEEQRVLLIKEGIQFESEERVNLADFGWSPASQNSRDEKLLT